MSSFKTLLKFFTAYKAFPHWISHNFTWSPKLHFISKMTKAQKGEQLIQHPQLAGNKTKWNLNPDLLDWLQKENADGGYHHLEEASLLRWPSSDSWILSENEVISLGKVCWGWHKIDSSPGLEFGLLIISSEGTSGTTSTMMTSARTGQGNLTAT